MSDGKQTPEQMKQLYKENGYSILAISDHDFLHAHNDLTEEDNTAV
jgi:predicted metal-dependent phosphoesterase TrpH